MRPLFGHGLKTIPLPVMGVIDDRLDTAAVGIKNKSRIIVRAVFELQSCRTIVLRSVLECRLVKAIDGPAGWRGKGEVESRSRNFTPRFLSLMANWSPPIHPAYETTRLQPIGFRTAS